MLNCMYMYVKMKTNNNWICIQTDYPIEDRYIGCFVQEENSLSNAKFELINTNVPSKCSAICHNAKYQFAGVMGWYIFNLFMFL